METISSTFISHLEEKDLHMHSMALSLGGLTTAEFYYSPVHKDSLQRVFSICKTFTGIAIGLLADEGKISLTDSICKHFPKYVNENTHKWLLATTIKDMLMMRTCHVNSTYNKFDLSTDWVGSFFTTLPTKEPGTSFNYDTSGSHVLCALVENITGMKLLDYIRSRIPELGISKEAYTILDGQGYSQGGTGLMCKTSDLLKLGNMLLYCNIEGKEPEYLSPFMISYLKEATSKLTDTSNFGKCPFERFGYGYQIWQADHNGILVYGMGGQFVMIHPDKELVFVTTIDNIGVSSKNQLVFDLFYQDVLSNIPDASSPKYTSLLSDLDNNSNIVTSLEIHHLSSDIVSKHNIPHKWTCKNSVSIFTHVYYDLIDSDEGKLTLISNDRTYTICFGINKNVTSTLKYYDMFYVASGAFANDNTLNIHLEFLGEALGSIDFTLTFNDSFAKLESVKHEETMFDEFSFVCDLVQ